MLKYLWNDLKTAECWREIGAGLLVLAVCCAGVGLLWVMYGGLAK